MTKGKGKRKAKQVGIFQSMMAALGYIPAPKKRAGKVSVKPYNRRTPAAKLPPLDPTMVTTGYDKPAVGPFSE
jgi:hypothetical protein